MATAITVLTTVTSILIAYLAGSLSSAIIVCKIMRLPDPRTQGSRNPGTTNVLRIGGKQAAILTLLGDMLKGYLPVCAAIYLRLDVHTIALVMFAAFIGHLYPIFFRGEGGKGVATYIGGLMALSWMVGCTFMELWIIIAAISRYSSLASISAALVAPFLVWFFTGVPAFYITSIFITLILCIRHKSNIQNLLAGKEKK